MKLLNLTESELNTCIRILEDRISFAMNQSWNPFHLVALHAKLKLMRLERLNANALISKSQNWETSDPI